MLIWFFILFQNSKKGGYSDINVINISARLPFENNIQIIFHQGYAESGQRGMDLWLNFDEKYIN